MAKAKAKKSANTKSASKSTRSVREKGGNGKMKNAKPVKVMAKKTNGSKNQKDQGDDIINLILDDHKALKQLIKVLKDHEKYDLEERQAAFEEFAPLLIMHAKPEEKTMYIRMKQDDETRELGFEGDVEHQLADQLVEEVKRTEDEDLWSARVKVLAELVEHHIEEEEEELLPDFRKHTEKEEREQLAQEFLKFKTELQDLGRSDTVEEETEIEEDEETEDMLTTMR